MQFTLIKGLVSAGSKCSDYTHSWRKCCWLSRIEPSCDTGPWRFLTTGSGQGTTEPQFPSREFCRQQFSVSALQNSRVPLHGPSFLFHPPQGSLACLFHVVRVYRFTVCVCVSTWATHTSFILVFLKLRVSYKVLGFIRNNTAQTLKGSIVWGSRGLLSTSGIPKHFLNYKWKGNYLLVP